MDNLRSYLNCNILPKLCFQKRDSDDIFIGLGNIPIQSGSDFFDKFEKLPKHVFFFLIHKFYSTKPMPFLPRYQIRIQNNKIHTFDVLNNTTHIDLTPQSHASYVKAQILEKTISPQRQEWTNLFEKITMQFKKNTFQKIVPARQVQLTLNTTVDSSSFFEKISKPNSYNFFLQFTDANTFLGSSPERFFKFEHGKILTEAIAGTRPKANALELLTSKKDLYEHELVVADITQKIKPYSNSITTSDPYIVESKNLAHLKTTIEAVPLSTNLFDLIDALHPTAAVCGMPKAESLNFLKSTESFDRGYYAAPFGVFNREFADLCVAIRSAVIEGTKINLYSGVGVVPDSQPELEWRELDLKIQPYFELFV